VIEGQRAYDRSLRVGPEEPGSYAIHSEDHDRIDFLAHSVLMQFVESIATGGFSSVPFGDSDFERKISHVVAREDLQGFGVRRTSSRPYPSNRPACLEFESHPVPVTKARFGDVQYFVEVSEPAPSEITGDDKNQS